MLRHEHREVIRLEEAGPGAHAAILRRYLERAPRARSRILVGRGAPAQELERIAAQYPVFRGIAVSAISRPPASGRVRSPRGRGQW